MRAIIGYFVVAFGSLCWSQTPTKPYAEIIERETLLRHPELSSLAVTIRDPVATQERTIASNAGVGGGCEQTVPLRDTPGENIGTLRVTFFSSLANGDCSKNGQKIADELQQVIPSEQTLFDPFIVSDSASDVLAQRLTIETLERYPDVLVLAFHVTAPGDTVNRVVGINEPKFLGRPSDEVDTEIARNGKTIIQLIPSTHRMETHMPLRAADGSLVGTLVTVYLWHNEAEAPGLIARSLKIRDELQPRIPGLTSLLTR